MRGLFFNLGRENARYTEHGKHKCGTYDRDGYNQGERSDLVSQYIRNDTTYHACSIEYSDLRNVEIISGYPSSQFRETHRVEGHFLIDTVRVCIQLNVECFGLDEIKWLIVDRPAFREEACI